MADTFAEVQAALAGQLSRVQTKALGNATADLTYTPVTPCRLFDTRASQGGQGTPTVGVRRTYGATTPVANQGNVAGCAAAAGAAVALIQIGTLTPSGNGLLQGGAQGVVSFPNALILYQPGDQYGTAVAMPLNPANGQFDLVEQFAAADLYGDLLGYFAHLPGHAPRVRTPTECSHGRSQEHRQTLQCPAQQYALTGGRYMADPRRDPSGSQRRNRQSQRANRSPVTLVSRRLGMPHDGYDDPVIDFRPRARATCCRVRGGQRTASQRAAVAQVSNGGRSRDSNVSGFPNANGGA